MARLQRKRLEKPLDPTQAADELLDRFPRRTGPERYVYFDSLPAPTANALRHNGYAPVMLATLPRESERDHKAYLLALTQGMAEGTVFASKERLQAAELDLRAHGMLSRYARGLQDDNKRKHDVETTLLAWDQGKHTVSQSTITDPKEIERILRSKAGILVLQPEEKKAKMKRKWKRTTKGSNE